MEGFVNQVKSYLGRIENLIKELHKNLIASNGGQVICTAFNASTSGAVQEVLRVTGKGSVKNVTIAARDGVVANNIQVNIDGKSKVLLPNIYYPYQLPKYLGGGKEGTIEINEILKFENEFSITGIITGSGLTGHVIYTLAD